MYHIGVCSALQYQKMKTDKSKFDSFMYGVDSSSLTGGENWHDMIR